MGRQSSCDVECRKLTGMWLSLKGLCSLCPATIMIKTSYFLCVMCTGRYRSTACCYAQKPVKAQSRQWQAPRRCERHPFISVGFTLWPMLVLNSYQPSCLNLPNAEITGMSHHSQWSLVLLLLLLFWVSRDSGQGEDQVKHGWREEREKVTSEGPNPRLWPSTSTVPSLSVSMTYKRPRLLSLSGWLNLGDSISKGSATNTTALHS